MPQSLKFVKLKSNCKGLMARAVSEFNRYLPSQADDYQWVFVDEPAVIARVLEILADDLQETDIADVVIRMPYLILLMGKRDKPVQIPVEATFAFLSVLNRAELVTLLRQCNSGRRLVSHFGLDSADWKVVFFMLGGVPDLDHGFQNQVPSNCSFYLQD